ncbi:MAG: hypothetical protein JNM63_09540 [Spirochaetia bacterium]|nr:hypothetical protein [Spirochaetia bacterium]
MIRSLFVFLFAILSATALFSQSDYSIEFGFRGFVPQVDADLVRSNGAGSFKVRQAAFWQRDVQPFPFISSGIFAEFLWNQDKLSWGGGYEYASDFLSVDPILATNTQYEHADTSFSARTVNHGLYGKVLFHLKHERDSSVFAGLKAGIHLYQLGAADLLSGTHLALSDVGALRFYNLPFQSLSFALYGGLIVGVKFSLFKLFKDDRLGFRIFAEYDLVTDSASLSPQTWDASQKKITGTDAGRKFVFNFSGLMINVGFFLSFPRVNPNRGKSKTVDPLSEEVKEQHGNFIF